MKPAVDSWIAPPEGPVVSRRHACISTDTYKIGIETSGTALPHWPIAVSICCGPFSMSISADVARILAQQFAAAADHYDAQVAALAATEAS
ncbi:hypothetical protein ABRY95_00020 [Castellaniella ginsengisoli]|jgi:hypothetical protein|uniref:FHA domain-containing protein n=1 Tax=Castellaniella ginsengisoli TaxID=546114 RepID=A0AB39GTS4_9BURK